LNDSLKGVAYHEAGHMIVAALSGLSLGRCGLRLDEEGFGLACYKKPQDATSPEVETLIIAAYAGVSAHEEFYRLYPEEQRPIGAFTDMAEVEALLDKRYRVRGDAWYAEPTSVIAAVNHGDTGSNITGTPLLHHRCSWQPLP